MIVIRLLPSVVFCLAMLFPLSSSGQQQVEFDSINANQWSEIVNVSGAPQKLTARLFMPPGADKVGAQGKLPAVIISHTWGGYSDSHEGKYARELAAAGYIALAIDHFSRRGFSSQDQRYAQMMGVADALYALKFLSAHPLVDASRVGVTGFSRGGQVSIYTAYEALRRGVMKDSNDNNLRFAAHVNFYGPCSYSPPRAAGLTGSPVLMLQGEKDVTGPRDGCQRLAGFLNTTGGPVPIEVTVFPGAFHDFTRPNASSSSQANDMTICPIQVLFAPGNLGIQDDLTATPLAPDWFQQCSKRGIATGYNADATAKANQMMRDFFARHLAKQDAW